MSFYSFFAFAQTNDSLSLKDKQYVLAETMIYIINKNAGVKSTIIDTNLIKQFSSRSLAEILQVGGQAYIKQIAPGQLSSISMRGGNANQTQILWAGFNLNNLITGQTDFSLVPMALFESAEILSGATAANMGNGMVTGSIQLDSRMWMGNWKTNSVYHFSVGSFGKEQFSFKFFKKNENSFFSIKSFAGVEQNNYNYIAINGSTLKVENAKVNAFGLMLSSGVEKKKYFITTDYWLQNYNRENPVFNGAFNNRAKQQDINSKLCVNLQRSKNGPFSNIRFGWFYDELNYKTNSMANYDGFMANTLIAETEGKFNVFKKNLLSYKLSSTFTEAQNTGYDAIHFIFRKAILLSYTSKLAYPVEKQIAYNLSLREEMNNNVYSVPVINAGAEKQLCKINMKKHDFLVKLIANAGTVYRFPTLNDLYWTYGGNKNLKPEWGYSGSMSLINNLLPNENSALKVTLSTTHFERYMYDQIIWYPAGFYWSPQNLQQVWSRGFEHELKFIVGNRVKINSSTLLNYTISTLQKSSTYNPDAIGKQLIYVPIYNASSRLALTVKQFLVEWQVNYYGYRFTTTDNAEYLEPFLIHNLFTSCFYRLKKSVLELNFSLNNIFNQNYSWVAGRPAMPRNMLLSLKFSIQNKSKINSIK